VRRLALGRDELFEGLVAPKGHEVGRGNQGSVRHAFSKRLPQEARSFVSSIQVGEDRSPPVCV